MTNQEMIDTAKKYCHIIHGDVDCFSCPNNCILKKLFNKSEIASIISAYNNPLSNPMK